MKRILSHLREALKAAWRRKWLLFGLCAAAMFLPHWEGDARPWGADAVIDLSEGPAKTDYPSIQINDDASHIRIAWFRPYSGKSIEEEAPICLLDYDIRARRSSLSYPQRVDSYSYHWHEFGPGPGLLRVRYHAMPFPTWGLRGGSDLSLTPCLLVGWNGLAEFYFQDKEITRTLAWNGRIGGDRGNAFDHSDFALHEFRLEPESRYAVLVPDGGHSIYLFDLVPGRAKGLTQGPKPSDEMGTHKNYLSIHKKITNTR